MYAIRAELVERQKEVNDFMAMIDGENRRALSVTTAATIKSVAVLMLYNAVEATVTLVLTRLHDAIRPHKYVDLSPALRRLWVEYAFTNGAQKDQVLHADEIVAGSLTFPTFQMFTRKVNLYSGNLDARKIDSLLEKYGAKKITARNRSCLLLIKNKRNKLAHGEQMFKESCRDLVPRELQQMKDGTFAVLTNLVDIVDGYISSQSHLSANQ
jgi:MAE_28990/MAE_18760-like HEPN